MSVERVIVIKINEDGIAQVSPTVPISEIEAVKSDIQEPRWSHWRKRKLASLWYATLLGMNIEPSSKSRAALKLYEPTLYDEYKDRLDIAKSLIGYELEFYENHMLEGNRAGEKYVMLSEYYEFAKKQEWQNLELMFEGLAMATSPPKLEMRGNLKNNLFVLLNETLIVSMDGKFKGPAGEKAALLLTWLKEKGSRSPVELRTLVTYMVEMEDAVEAFGHRKS
jgi:hypothetical protein